ncbi:radical SAM family heme chaperone HemW [Thermotoga sp. SG1]|uniref:radical SAM family heme chaperone HemW n=1 Tax=Thermotoga sp. SG1 TaxID=126739 RepID=UPI000C791C01|nr:radical SAM family heme chaperone HemW [Thermotoga sp. SG1]PLV56195.1 coproporphyrinogen III oxidase [Thermotoga sp. SG1]
MRLAVYVHIPFCKRKCVYCDFYSLVSEDFEEYLSLVFEEIELYRDVLEESEIETVYFGGGTPSLVPPSFLEKILEKLEKVSKKFSPHEITIEVNPESVDREKLRSYRKMGIDRISLGVQSCDDEVLKRCGRLYDEKMIKEKAELVLEEFDNVNFDFILGLPGETDETMRKNLHFLEKFTPQHVSLYFLEVDENTTLHSLLKKNLLTLPDSEEVERRHDAFVEFLKSGGFSRYEISNFAKPGKESKHNLFYWRNHDYLGFGPSAGGHFGRFRYTNVSDLPMYTKMVKEKVFPYDYQHENTEEEEALETLFMGLRTKEGVELKRVEKLMFLVKKLQKEYACYVKVKDGKIFLSEKGMDLSKKIFEDLIEWYGEAEK